MRYRLVVVAWLASLAMTATAQDFTKPIRFVTSNPGSFNDIIGRLIGQGITGPLGQPVIMDNRASTLISGDVVSKSAPDGSTFLIAGTSLWVGPLLQKMPYDIQDFAPVTLVSRDVFILVVHPASPAKNVKELIALAKSRPGALNYSSGATGGSNHLASEMFRSMAGIDIVRVPYKGTPAAVAAVASRDVDLTLYDLAVIAPLVKAGKLLALGVSSAAPSSQLPDVPPIGASLPGYEATGSTAMLAPIKTPAALIRRMNQEVVRVLNQPDVRAKITNAGSELVASSPEELGILVKNDTAKFAKVIKEANIKVD